MRQRMDIISSIKTIIGGKPIYHSKVILDKSGNPVSLKQFRSVVNSPERLVMREPFSHEFFQKSPKEKAILRAAKKDYKENMKALLGSNWKVLSNSLGVYNIPDDPKVITEIQGRL